jgi:putative tryptophan/tyrosine transport system substrate-binding protein
MRRRDFIAGLGGAAAWPLAARAQQPGVPVVGVLSGASLEQARNPVAGFFQGLGKTGYIEGRNVAVEYRWADGDNAQLPALAADLVRRQVSVIVVLGSTPGALAAKAATQRIPIVYGIGADPVQVGLAASLARPGGNLTGATNIVVELLPKCLSVMHELVRAASTIAVLLNPANVPFFETERRDVDRRIGCRPDHYPGSERCRDRNGHRCAGAGGGWPRPLGWRIHGRPSRGGDCGDEVIE